MWKYIARRLMLALPTLLFISLLAFALNQCTPGDPVAERLTVETSRSTGGNPADQATLYSANYRRLAHQLGIDQPLFYVSVTSLAWPDTFHRVLPLDERKATQQLVARYGNWPAIQTYRSALQQWHTRLLQLNEPRAATALAHTEQLKIQHDPARIARLMDSLSVAVHQANSAITELSGEFNQLSYAYRHVTEQPTRWRHYVPVVRWYGIHNRYHSWLSRVWKGDFGNSLVSAQEVSEKISRALRWTLQLNLSAIVLAYLLAIPLGVGSALYAHTAWDKWLNLGLFFLYALPSFWVASLLSQFLATPDWLNWFPSMGVGDVPVNATVWEVMGIRIHHFALPVFCLTYGSLAYISRQVRTSMIKILNADYIRTARAKGLDNRTIVWRHAFPNALFPLITMFGGLLPRAVAGSVIVERIFNIPGVGNLTIDAIYANDWPVVYTLLLLTAVLTVVGILLADILYAWADPRVQLTKSDTYA
ncbi:MAG: ABC transporter permease [Saprospiraceae bacterium]